MPKQTGLKGERRETSYIVRIYQCDAEHIVGVVEMPVQERRAAFRSFTELKAILTGTFANVRAYRGTGARTTDEPSGDPQ